MTVFSLIQEKFSQSIALDWENDSDRSVESALIERAKTDPAAFGQLYEIHYSAILNYIYHRTFNVAVAEDLTSNTFFNALKSLPKFRPRAPFRAWLYRIAANEVRTYFRKNTRRRSFEKRFSEQDDSERIYFPLADLESASDAAADQERFRVLHNALLQLPDKYQNILALRYLENLNHQEIADALGKRVGTVKSLVHRGLERIRKILHKENATILSDRR